MASAIGVDGDTAGGTVSASTTKCFVSGKAVLRINDSVAGHGDHDPTVMVEGNAKMIVEGLAVCVDGNKAGCGHGLAASGSRLLIG